MTPTRPQSAAAILAEERLSNGRRRVGRNQSYPSYFTCTTATMNDAAATHFLRFSI
jgi:hypothetical protein